MKRGEGYRTEYKDYKLYVEATSEGWEVRVYDVPGRKFAYQNSVEGPTIGKDDAISTAVVADNPQATWDDVAQAKNLLKWELYGPE
jgi:hypothetical protein